MTTYRTTTMPDAIWDHVRVPFARRVMACYDRARLLDRGPASSTAAVHYVAEIFAKLTRYAEVDDLGGVVSVEVSALPTWNRLLIDSIAEAMIEAPIEHRTVLAAAIADLNRPTKPGEA